MFYKALAIAALSGALWWGSRGDVSSIALATLGVVGAIAIWKFGTMWSQYADLQQRWSSELLATVAASSTHDQAVSVLADSAATGVPFGLFLRSFDLEAHQADKPIWVGTDEGLGWHTVQQITLNRSVEKSVSIAFAGKLRLVAIANPLDRLEQMGGAAFGPIPRLYLPRQNWIGVVQMLIDSAAVIIVACDSPTAGMTAELNAIKASKRENSTVIVIAQDRKMHAHLTALGANRSGGHAAAQDAERLRSQVASFPMVVSEEHVVAANASAWIATAAAASRKPAQQARDALTRALSAIGSNGPR